MFLLSKLLQELAFIFCKIAHAHEAVDGLWQASIHVRATSSRILLLFCKVNKFILQLEIIVVGQVALDDLHQAWFFVLLVGLLKDLAVLVLAKVSLVGHLEYLVILVLVRARATLILRILLITIMVKLIITLD